MSSLFSPESSVILAAQKAHVEYERYNEASRDFAEAHKIWFAAPKHTPEGIEAKRAMDSADFKREVARCKWTTAHAESCWARLAGSAR